MGQSDPEYSEFGTVLADGGDRFAVSAICFDSEEELLWMGNEGVRIYLLFTVSKIQYVIVLGPCYILLWFGNAKVYVISSACNRNGSSNFNDWRRHFGILNILHCQLHYILRILSLIPGINSDIFEASNTSWYSKIYTSFVEHDWYAMYVTIVKSFNYWWTPGWHYWFGFGYNDWDQSCNFC